MTNLWADNGEPVPSPRPILVISFLVISKCPSWAAAGS